MASDDNDPDLQKAIEDAKKLSMQQLELEDPGLAAALNASLEDAAGKPAEASGKPAVSPPVVTRFCPGPMLEELEPFPGAGYSYQAQENPPEPQRPVTGGPCRRAPPMVIQRPGVDSSMVPIIDPVPQGCFIREPGQSNSADGKGKNPKSP